MPTDHWKILDQADRAWRRDDRDRARALYQLLDAEGCDFDAREAMRARGQKLPGWVYAALCIGFYLFVFWLFDWL